eukprot:10293203-Alexandrium_andersonii.AAC.1
MLDRDRCPHQKEGQQFRYWLNRLTCDSGRGKERLGGSMGCLGAWGGGAAAAERRRGERCGFSLVCMYVCLGYTYRLTSVPRRSSLKPVLPPE